LAQGVWRNWLKVRADWQLRSTRNDTLEQPEPFVWISFHDEAAYGRFMKEFRPKSTSGSRAYYSTETHSVYIRPLVGPNNRDVQKNMQKAVPGSGWDRVKLGTVSLAEGENFLELEIPAGSPVGVSALEIVRPEIDGKITADAMAVRQTPDWFKDAGYGLMFQWTNRATPPAGETKPWNRKVDDFDIDSLFNLVDRSGAMFVIWSVTWGQQYISAPLRSLDRILPGRTTERDLLGELADGLKSRGIRLIFYYHYGYDCYSRYRNLYQETLADYQTKVTAFLVKNEAGDSGESATASEPRAADAQAILDACKAGEADPGARVGRKGDRRRSRPGRSRGGPC
jgi:hypothetical protein